MDLYERRMLETSPWLACKKFYGDVMSAKVLTTTGEPDLNMFCEAAKV